MNAEVDILKKTKEIDSRDIIEEFNIQVQLYEKQLSDARTEIQKHINSKSYQLNYDPPKIFEEGGKKRVRPGTVSYSIHR